MKNFLTLALLIFSLSMTAQRKIGEVRNGAFVITENITDIKTNWQDLCKKNGITSTLTQWAIVEKRDGTDVYYLLTANTADNLTHMATGLNRQANVFFLGGEEFSRTVTCTGCTVGCSPTYSKRAKLWSCELPCSACTKSETVTID